MCPGLGPMQSRAGLREGKSVAELSSVVWRRGRRHYIWRNYATVYAHAVAEGYR